MFVTLSMLSRLFVLCLSVVYISILAEFVDLSYLSLVPTIEIEAVVVSGVLGLFCYFIFVKAK